MPRPPLFPAAAVLSSASREGEGGGGGGKPPRSSSSTKIALKAVPPASQKLRSLAPPKIGERYQCYEPDGSNYLDPKLVAIIAKHTPQDLQNIDIPGWESSTPRMHPPPPPSRHTSCVKSPCCSPWKLCVPFAEGMPIGQGAKYSRGVPKPKIALDKERVRKIPRLIVPARRKTHLKQLPATHCGGDCD
jgi:hypothetical protein